MSAAAQWRSAQPSAPYGSYTARPGNAVAVVELPTAMYEYKLPCTRDSCTCAWVPYFVGDQWYVARACGSCRVTMTKPRFQFRPWDFQRMGDAALDKAVRLNRLYGIGAAGWTA